MLHTWNLGVTFDSTSQMKQHINSVCCASLMAIRKIGQIRKYLDVPTTLILIHAFITSRLDSCNSLLIGLPVSEVKKLQHIQNTAARLVVRAKRHSHITPILHQLHWLAVEDRIVFKVLLITFKALHGIIPSYISEMIVNYCPSRSLRSSSKMLLQIPKTSTSTYGQRAFSAVAPRLWNELPLHIRCADSVESFKALLKKHLFSKL